MHDMITPRSKEWRNEVARCAHFLANEHPGEECIFFNDTKNVVPRPSGWTILWCQEWLNKSNHYINNAEDETFLRMQIVALTNSLLESNNEQENTGNLWEKTGLSHITAGCRIAHCIVSSMLREAYLT